MKIISILISLIFMTSCATLVSPRKPDLNIGTIESVKLGSDAKTVSDILGSASEIRRMKAHPNTEFWIYNNSDPVESHRATVEVDSGTRRVMAVVITPSEREAESKIQFLLKTKFSASTFQIVPLQICSRDYIPSQVFYVDVKNGVLIRSNKNTDEVENFSRVSGKAATDLIDKIKKCQL